MSRYGQYCPITRALVIRDLIVGARRFNELSRGLPGLSRALLSKRLSHLEHHGLVVRTEEGYEPTRACEELHPIVFGLAEWGARWAFGEPREDELDPVVLMWWIRGGIDAHAFAGERTVLHVRLPEARRTRFWLVVQPEDVSLCFNDPGFEVDVTIETSLSVLYQVWEGVLELPAAVRAGTLSITGRSDVRLRLPEAFLFSPAAPIVRRVVPEPVPV